jgi:Fe-S-cluster containining protein
MYTMNNPQSIPEGIDIETLRAEASKYLTSENRRHIRRAKNSGRKNCQRCGFCCLAQPCVPRPDEFTSIADYLNITPQELASKYAVINECKDGFYLLWARETQTDMLGQYIPYYRTYDRGYCIFFNKKNHGCLIHEVRPISAKDTKCWKRKIKERKLTWTTEQIRAVLPDFNLNIGELSVVSESGEVTSVFGVYQEE